MADLDKSVKDNLEYIIKFTVDSDYYLERYDQMKDAVKEIITNKKWFSFIWRCWKGFKCFGT